MPRSGAEFLNLSANRKPALSISLQTIIQEILENYLASTAGIYKESPIASLLRNSMPIEIRKFVEDKNRYIVKGSAGNGGWVGCPWVAVLDSLVTDSAHRGFYITFLFRADMSGFYLSLNQGVTDIQKEYKTKSSEVLKIKAADLIARVGKPPEGFSVGEIRLGGKSNSPSALYDYGNILSKFYSKIDVPSDEKIRNDFSTILEVYQRLVFGNLQSDVEIEEFSQVQSDSEDFYKESKNRAFHSKIERNRSLVKKVKLLQGTTCKACCMNFDDVYGEIANGYIEVHHKVPISKLVGTTHLSPMNDFIVLCANCHRMIHKISGEDNLDQLKKIIASRKK